MNLEDASKKSYHSYNKTLILCNNIYKFDILSNSTIRMHTY